MSNDFKWKNNCVRLIFHPIEYVDINTAQIWTKQELKQLIYRVVKKEKWQENEHIYTQYFVEIIGKQLTLF